KTAGNRQKSNKTEGDNAKIALEWLFFELKSDSAINQALIRPSLILLIPGRTVAATPNSGSYAALRYISHESCIDNDRVGAESAGQDDRDSTPARMLGKRDTCPVV
ncbi:MAG: hypothetical protein VX393_08640, partial [Pseudomonadota bacterium]|nr:hypothetical protein [Pseudomonadota bacterium]